MIIKKVNVKEILKLEDSRFYQLLDNQFGINNALPGSVWKLLYYREVNEYLDSQKQKKTVTVNV